MKKLIAAAVVLASLVVVPAAPAGAEDASVVEVGWWTRRPSASAPAGGFEVARAPDGELSVAAVRIVMEPGRLTKAILVLKEAGGIRQDAAVIKACLTTSPWTAAAGGQMSAAPKSDCAQSVTLTRDASLATWAGDLANLLRNASGSASVMLVPAAPAGALPLDPGYQVQVGGVLLDAEAQPPTTATGPSSSGSGGSGAPSSGTGAPASVGSSTDDDSGFSGFDAASSFRPIDTIGGVGTLNPDSAAAVASAPPTAEGESATPAIDARLQPTAATGPGERVPPPPWGRLFWLVPLSIAVGAAIARVRVVLRDRGALVT